MSVELRREVLLARLRRRRAIVVAALGAGTFAAVFALWPRDEVRIVRTSSTHVITVPTPIEVERTVVVPRDRASCPPPRTDAPRRQPAQPPEPVAFVQPSATNAGWIAAWNEEHVFVSMDAGASWQQAFDGPGGIRDVDFDCHGRAVVVRGDRLGVREGSEERWYPLHHFDLSESYSRASVIGGGPDIAVVGVPRGDDLKARLAISRDGGATWELRALAENWEGDRVVGRQHEDGRILAMLPQPDCMSTYAWIFEYRDGVVTPHETNLGANLAFAGDVIVAARGWQRVAGAELHDHAGIGDGYPTVIEGPRPLLADTSGLLRFSKGRLAKLPWQVHADGHSLIADRAERLWYLACGKLAIASRTIPEGLCVGE